MQHLIEKLQYDLSNYICVYYRFNSKQAEKKCRNPKAKRYLKQKGSLNLSFTRLHILGSSFYAWSPHHISNMLVNYRITITDNVC